ncbi:FKBP-type peptidyl-prolyl cis-trans isomerase [Ornithinimicrobium pekingense]|uniref:peptidylprolyl isomerase n=1 Tax=Ornithinimicrobium pekingense TaxID=384677 RepID=A0ABQ2FD06_9MICO|nr:FKBP-type peptidyl-prolyl cis-trans isomerase [Ornithinimicrobium pekingense]GGK75445.1 peptidylprolyl isomerase [Ornithinimicrobium pekingense]
MRSPRLRLAALAAAPLLLLSACSTEGSDGDTADQTATTDDAAATSMAPTGDISELSVDTSGDEPQIQRDGEAFADSELPFVVGSTEVETVEEGDGDEVEADHEVQVRYVALNGADGEPFASTFETDETVTIDLNNELLFPAFLEQLPGRSVGETLLMTIPAEAGFGSNGNPQLEVGPQDTLVFYMEIVDSSAPLTEATGEAVEPEEGLPEVEADGENAATITIPEDAEEPSELVTQLLIEGEGAEVQAGQTIKVHYTGVKFSDGEVFDESYQRGEPTQFPIGVGNVIQGWDEGLVGQKVGSRVLLVIPAEQAYGEAPEDTEGATAPPAHELAGETLVFVVDILGAY